MPCKSKHRCKHKKRKNFDPCANVLMALSTPFHSEIKIIVFAVALALLEKTRLKSQC